MSLVTKKATAVWFDQEIKVEAELSWQMLLFTEISL